MLKLENGVICDMRKQRLRILDLNTPWVWLTVFYYRSRYGKPWLECALWSPHKWKRFWLNAWRWEDIPDERGQMAMKPPDDGETVLATTAIEKCPSPMQQKGSPMNEKQRIVTFPSSPSVCCPNCESNNVKTTVERETFTYGEGCSNQYR